MGQRDSMHPRRSQRDIVYLGLPIASSYTSDIREKETELAVYSCAHGAQFIFNDLIPFIERVLSSEIDQAKSGLIL
jgi:hypothetical protein